MFRRKLSAKDHADMWNQQLAAAAKANGTFKAFPRLTNDEVLQLVDYWNLAAKKKGATFPTSFEIAKLALGFFKEGDKFKTSKAHAAKMFPEQFLSFVWNSPSGFQEPAFRLKGTPHPFRPTAKTHRRIHRIAKLAFARLQRVRAARKARRVARIKTTVVTLPPGKEPAAALFKFRRKKKKGEISSLLWLLLVAVALSQR